MKEANFRSWLQQFPQGLIEQSKQKSVRLTGQNMTRASRCVLLISTGEKVAACVPKQRSALIFHSRIDCRWTIPLQMEGLLPPPTTTTTTTTLHPLTNASVDLLEESDSSSALEDVANHLRLLNLTLSMLVSLSASLLPFLLRFLCSDNHHLRLGLLVKLSHNINFEVKPNQASSIGVVGSHSVTGISQPLFPLLYFLTLLTIYTLSISQSLPHILATGKQNVKETEANENTAENNTPPSSLNLDQNCPQFHLEGLISSSDYNQGNFWQSENIVFCQTQPTSAWPRWTSLSFCDPPLQLHPPSSLPPMIMVDTHLQLLQESYLSFPFSRDNKQLLHGSSSMSWNQQCK